MSSGPGRRASAGQLLDAARAAHALEVIVLPNDGDTVMAAEAAASAAEQEGITLHVVRSRTAVQGLAALAVFDADGRPPRATPPQMSHAAAATRHGAVAVASKQALTSAGPCEPGDVLGAVAGDVVIVGHDLEEVAIDVVARLLSSGGEIVTVIGGADAPDGLADALGARIERGHRDVEVSRHRRWPAALPAAARSRVGVVGEGTQAPQAARRSSRTAAPKLAKHRGLAMVGDLLEFWPRRYLEHTADLARLHVGMYVVAVARSRPPPPGR